MNIGTIVGQDEALTTQQHAMISAFVSMVTTCYTRSRQIRSKFGRQVDTTMAKDPLEDKNDNEEENESLMVELSHMNRYKKSI